MAATDATPKSSRPLHPVTGEPEERRTDPSARLRFAYGRLPAKRAFREAAVALRAMIREQRNGGESPEANLRELYRFATLYAVVYPPSPDGPTSALLDDGPTDGEVWAQVESLALPYEDIGYERLELLNKTDVTWLVEAWGEPDVHSVPLVRRDASPPEPETPPKEKSASTQPTAASAALTPPTERPASATPATEKETAAAKAEHPKDSASAETEPEIYRPPAIERMEEALAPKARHRYDGGLVPAPEGSEDPVYDLMDRIATKKKQKRDEARAAKLLKRAASLVGLGE